MLYRKGNKLDKRVIFAVAGSGKTTYIVNSLSPEKRSLIITYTNANFDNLSRKIAEKFNGKWPENITLMRYFPFLYQFCYKPFLSDQVGARGVVFGQKPNQYVSKKYRDYYLTKNGYFYDNRLALFLEKVIDDIKERIEAYFDEFIIDEIQDIAGRDFSFLESLMLSNVNMLFVGDFFQHTFDTSRDGNANRSLFSNRPAYERRFARKSFIIDASTLTNSWRCSRSVCEFVSTNLGINISSNRNSGDDTGVFFVTESAKKQEILANPNIIKLHYQNSQNYGFGHRNWGDTKGEDCYEDVCVMLNKKSAKMHSQSRLCDMAPSTRNKLYVAITRAHGSVYLIYE